MFMHIWGSKIEHLVNLFHSLESPTKPIDQHDTILHLVEAPQAEGRFPGSWEELYSRVLLLGSKKAPGMYKTL